MTGKPGAVIGGHVCVRACMRACLPCVLGRVVWLCCGHLSGGLSTTAFGRHRVQKDNEVALASALAAILLQDGRVAPGDVAVALPREQGIQLVTGVKPLLDALALYQGIVCAFARVRVRLRVCVCVCACAWACALRVLD